jgi:glucose dehydrogenase
MKRSAVPVSVLLLACALGTSTAVVAQRASSTATRVWGYGGGPLQNRYSPLRQINRSNVKQLQLAWI